MHATNRLGHYKNKGYERHHLSSPHPCVHLLSSLTHAGEYYQRYLQALSVISSNKKHLKVRAEEV